MAITYWTILPPILSDKDQSSVIFGSEKISEINMIKTRNLKIGKNQ